MDEQDWGGAASLYEDGFEDVKKTPDDKEETVAARARQRAIGRELRRMYDDVVQEPVPDDFIDLLKKIDEVRGKRDEPA